MRFPFTPFLGLSLAACVSPAPGPQAPPTPEAVEVATARASEAADLLGRRLMQELSRALDEGDAAAAVRVCSERAPAIAAELRAETGAAIGRTSLRRRNPANAPDGFERGVMEAWRAAGTAEPVAAVTPLPAGGRELRYLRPIVLQPLCVQCHGAPAEIPAPVRAALAERYPTDRAVGYHPGDLRGAFTARVPLD